MKLLPLLLLAILPAVIAQAEPPGELNKQQPPQSPFNHDKDDDHEGHNLLTNGNFEHGLKDWELIAFLKKGQMSIDPIEKHDGKPTLRIDNPMAEHSFVRQVLTGKPNTRYRLTGYIKTKNVQPTKKGEKCGAVLMVGMTLFCTPPIEHTSEWTKVTLDFTTKDKTEIRVGPSLGFYASYMTGTAWFADLKLIELGEK